MPAPALAPMVTEDPKARWATLFHYDTGFCFTTLTPGFMINLKIDKQQDEPSLRQKSTQPILGHLLSSTGKDTCFQEKYMIIWITSLPK